MYLKDILSFTKDFCLVYTEHGVVKMETSDTLKTLKLKNFSQIFDFSIF